jgi:hypothetical protein
MRLLFYRKYLIAGKFSHINFPVIIIINDIKEALVGHKQSNKQQPFSFQKAAFFTKQGEPGLLW